MAISLKTAGSWAESTAASTLVAMPGTPANGNRFFVWATWKDYSIGASMPAGWTKVTEWADGTTPTGNGAGSMKVACWYRDWATGNTWHSTNSEHTITFTTATGLLSQNVAHLLQKAGGDVWDPPVFQTAAWPLQQGPATVTGSSAAVNINAGAMVWCLLGIRDDAAAVTNYITDITDAGVTWNGADVPTPTNLKSSTTGNDMSCDLSYRLVTTGADTQTLGVAATLAANETGAVLWVVQNPYVSPSRAVALTGHGTLAATAVGPKMHTLTDNFATQDTAKWAGYSGTNVQATGGQLSIVPDNTWTRQLVSQNFYDLSESYALIKVTGLGSAQILSLAVDDGSFANRFELFYNFGDLIFRETVATVTNDTSLTGFNLTTHAWWRIGVSGNTVNWDTSEDGSSWTNRRSKTWAIPQVGALKALVTAYTASGTTAATLDDFNNAPAGQSLGGSLAVTTTGSGAARLNTHQDIGGSLAVTATVSGTARIVNQSIGGTLALTASGTGTEVRGQSPGGSLAVTATLSGAARVNTHQSIGGTLAVTASMSGATTAAQNIGGSLAVTAAMSGTLGRAQNIGGITLGLTASPSGTGQIVNQSVGGTLAETAATSGAAAYGQSVGGTLPVTTTLSGEARVNTHQTIGGTLEVTVTTSGAATNSHQSVDGSLAVTASGTGTAETAGTLEAVGSPLDVTATGSGAALLDGLVAGSLAETVTLTGAAVLQPVITGSLAVTVTVTGAARINTHQSIGGTLAVTATVSGAANRAQTMDGSLAVTGTPSGVADLQIVSLTAQNIDGTLAVTVTRSGTARLTHQSLGGALALAVTVTGTMIVTPITPLPVARRLIVSAAGRLIVTSSRLVTSDVPLEQRAAVAPALARTAAAPAAPRHIDAE